MSISKRDIDPMIEALTFLRKPFVAVAAFSCVINLLALTGPLFMLQVYDRVIPSRSVPTLAALVVLMILLFGFMGTLDSIRNRVTLRLGQHLDEELSPPVLTTVLLQSRQSSNKVASSQPMRDLEKVKQFVSSPGINVAFDLPWTPLYLLLVFLLHPLLGFVATCGAAALLILTALNERGVGRPMFAVTKLATARIGVVEEGRRNGEILAAMGMRDVFVRRYMELNDRYLSAQREMMDTGISYSVATRTFRYVLQSSVLAVAAGLAIEQKVTPGIMIAASIIASRSLAPIEQAISNWRGFVAARQSFYRLKQILSLLPMEAERTALPTPMYDLSVRELAIAPPGGTKAIVAGINFNLKAGDGLGIIGPSASGKSTLARTLVGVWPAARGTIRIDSADINQWSSEDFGRHVGYLPQDVELFEGSVAENIARFSSNASSEAIIAAAKQACAHEMILAMRGGYDAQIGEGGSILSAGQRQRIGLARALYGDPFLVVLDEPNSNTDAQGDLGVQHAITACRRRGGIVIVVAHRPSAIESINLILVLDRGTVREFGPKEDVLRKSVVAAPV